MIERQDSKTASLHYIYSASFLELLAQLNCSLFLSTYQAGKLIAIRVDSGSLSALVRRCDRAMGIAVTSDKLAVGSRRHIDVWRNGSPLPYQIFPRDRYYVTDTPFSTGDLGLREIAWGNGQLWIASTRFSGLYALEDCKGKIANSPFPSSAARQWLPVWQPPFITAIKAEDRCHLNGFAIAGGQPQYATVLGATDRREGWRENKAAGGCVLEIASGEIIARGLAMPHSPRVYRDRLWLLDSGWGRLVLLDPKTGDRTPIAEFPGFTRGLAFAQDYAFIGLSQGRDRATFSGLPLNRTGQRLECGVWAVNIETGQSIGFLKFQGGCTELFDVQVLPHCRYPTLL